MFKYKDHGVSIAEGKPTKQIASSLCLSIKTMESHCSSVMKKIGVNNIASCES
ncbi:MAG: LuxR C-terminal-related transcriptional regulator [Planctomycetota bacterium]